MQAYPKRIQSKMFFPIFSLIETLLRLLRLLSDSLRLSNASNEQRTAARRQNEKERMVRNHSRFTKDSAQVSENHASGSGRLGAFLIHLQERFVNDFGNAKSILWFADDPCEEDRLCEKKQRCENRNLHSTVTKLSSLLHKASNMQGDSPKSYNIRIDFRRRKSPKIDHL